MKIYALAGNSEIMFSMITIRTREKTFTFANATLSASMNEVTRYYDMEDWLEIKMEK